MDKWVLVGMGGGGKSFSTRRGAESYAAMLAKRRAVGAMVKADRSAGKTVFRAGSRVLSSVELSGGEGERREKKSGFMGFLS